jgi:hypothetical protein
VFAATISDGDNADISIGATTYVFKKRLSDEEFAQQQKLKKRLNKKNVYSKSGQ